jgi:UDP-N-acetylmuramoyl-tripeptide--D-alanyl-D-alanine ligase
MLELGEREAQYHFDIGQYAAELGIDCILCVGRLAKNVCAAARAKGADAHHFPDKELLMSALPSLIRPKDTVLVKASHGMRLDTVADWLIKNY